jgi:hypothetical protein
MAGRGGIASTNLMRSSLRSTSRLSLRIDIKSAHPPEMARDAVEQCPSNPQRPASSKRLRATAACGRDWHKAEDVVQRRHVVWLSIRRRPIVDNVNVLMFRAIRPVRQSKGGFYGSFLPETQLGLSDIAGTTFLRKHLACGPLYPGLT